ncbi:glucocorticoid modulatory element-binding protein 1-like [Aplochiton taeniatus]
MEGVEVTVSPGDVLIVKEEEEELSDNQRTQVILHLQPMLRGINKNIVDTGTTVLAIETLHDDSPTDTEEVEYGYPITCGDSRAVLLFKKFVCPGINIRCVKFNDQLISPKQFVHLAGKATLKDWKRAIRLGGVMLRKMMDSGQIDFYQHDTVCTNTCRSTKFDVLINSTRLLPEEIGEGPEEKACTTVEWNPGPDQPPTPAAPNGHVRRKRTDLPGGILSLWKGVSDIGLMGEVLSSIRTELQATLMGLEIRSDKAGLQEADAMVLNSLCEMFGLLGSVKRALDLRRCQMEEIHNTLFDGKLEEQRKLDEGSSRNTTPSKRSRPNRHSTARSHPQAHHQTILSPTTTTRVIQPITVAGLPVASLAQLPTGSQLYTHYSAASSAGNEAKTGPLHGPTGMTALSSTPESLSLTLDREQGAGDSQSQLKCHRFRGEKVV